MPPCLQQQMASMTLTPHLDTRGVGQLLAGLSASITCQESCRQEKRAQLRCPPSHVQACFAGCHDLHDPLKCLHRDDNATVNCTCTVPVFNPAEGLAVFGVALLIAGQTRSFMSPPIRSSLTNLIDKMSPAEIAIMAVLTTLSTNRGDQRPGGWSATTSFKDEQLDWALQSYGIPWRARYLRSVSNFSEAVAGCANHKLRDLLSRASNAISVHGGLHNSLVKRVLAFDLLLAYERAVQKTPKQVLFLRPDVLYLSSAQPADTSCSAVFVINDVFASMPRNFAGRYFTSFAMDYSIHDGLMNSTLLQEAKEAVSPSAQKLGGLVLMPHFHLAYYGVPFAGHGLEMAPNDIDCAGYEQSSRKCGKCV